MGKSDPLDLFTYAILRRKYGNPQSSQARPSEARKHTGAQTGNVASDATCYILEGISILCVT
jgi:hypothetical protein